MKRKKPSRKYLIKFFLLMLTIAIILWLNYFFGFLLSEDLKQSGNLRGLAGMSIPIIFTSTAVILLLEILRYNKDSKAYHYIAYIFAIPLIPLFLVAILSQTKLLASLTLPMMVLSILVPLSTYLFGLLELLNLGVEFNQNVIPYLNLTTISVVFIYLGKTLVKILAKHISDEGMPQIVKDATYELLEKKPFLKIAYGILTIFLIISTIENLGKITLINFLGQYKNISLQSLVTFAGIDRFVSKWKTS